MAQPNAADFLALYRDLGLDASCSLAAFRQACRRRIAARHPDRAAAQRDQGSTQSGNGSVLPIEQLIALYVAGVRFHRAHGRLPGAPADGLALRRQVPVVGTARPPVSRARRWPGVGLPAALAAIVVVISGIALLVGDQGDAASVADSGRAVTDGTTDTLRDGAMATVRKHARLRVGMTPETVRAIQGEPIRINEDLWDYGPSWLRFEDGQLVDWYSSPLRPLAVGTREARPRDTH